MGEHDDVRIFNVFTIAYRETLIAVPWVQRRGTPCGTVPLAHTSHLWLNRLLPTIGGWSFGFAKERDRIDFSAKNCAVSTLLQGRPLLEACFTNDSAPGRPNQFPNFAELRPVFEQTFIQRWFVVGPTCVEKMDFHIDEATLQPVAATVQIFDGFRKSIPRGTYTFPPLDAARLGAFRVDLFWTLTTPFCCRALP